MNSRKGKENNDLFLGWVGEWIMRKRQAILQLFLTFGLWLPFGIGWAREGINLRKVLKLF
jgi:hypothetical protein